MPACVTSATSSSGATSPSRTCARTTTRSSTRSARRSTASSESPAKTLERSYAATDFVGWYNGHPDFAEHEFDLRGERAVVIGAGNVALDVARMLMLSERELACTDVADHALAVLARSKIREVLVVARRGPQQAAFTNPELLELAELSEAEVAVSREDIALCDGLEDPGIDPIARRNDKIVRGYAALAGGEKARRIELRFLLSPIEIHGEHARRGRDVRSQRARRER